MTMSATRSMPISTEYLFQHGHQHLQACALSFYITMRHERHAHYRCRHSYATTTSSLKSLSACPTSLRLSRTNPIRHIRWPSTHVSRTISMTTATSTIIHHIIGMTIVSCTCSITRRRTLPRRPLRAPFRLVPCICFHVMC